MRAFLQAVVATWIGLAGCLPSSAPGPTMDPRGRTSVVAPPHAADLEAAVDLDGKYIGPLAPTGTGTVAIVFASWCGHCREEIPILDQLRAYHPGLRILGVNYYAHEAYDGRGDALAVRAFVQELAPWLRVVPADEAMWSRLGRPPKVPTIFVFDRRGTLARVYDRRVAALPTFQDLDAVVRALP